MGETSVMKYEKSRPIEVIEIEALMVDDTLADAQSKYHTRFCRGGKQIVNVGLLQTAKGRKHDFCCVSSTPKKHGWTTCCQR